ncbi:MAG: YggT family protein [Polaromonas sp.]|uniref:YggT family protein n=1 Tax=Polaromonas sp. TaxID=1869339 RepID=UPI0013B7C94A|nr:YggT family protein [Polaromonas sp.]NDP63568.1 YggT family protein [Polaromonas sp.]
MLIRILAFLLETAFFVLIAAALLRAWMNWLRVSMTGQPGSFVMALTDWLVKPLRRSLPKAWTKSRVDWASVLAAALMALVYATFVGLLFGVLGSVGEGGLDWTPGVFLMLPLIAVKMLLRVVLQTVFMLVLGYAILSWVQPGSSVYGLLARLTEPLLTPVRRVIPTIGGVDLSALVLLVVLQIAMMVLI